MIRLRRMVLLVCLGCLAAGAPALAQPLSISIFGTVDDGTGVVPDAIVTLKDPAGATREIRTDGTGKYRFDGLRPGDYQITVGREGYASTTRSVTLAGQSQTVDVTLDVGGLSASVDVTAPSLKLPSLKDENPTGSRLGLTELETPATVQSVTGDAIQLRGETNIVEALSHSTGVATLPEPGDAGIVFAVRGLGPYSVTLLYDGIKSLVNTGSVTYPYDTWNVDRIEVLSGPASVLYGGGAIGAAINVTPRKPSDVRGTAVRFSGGSFKSYSAAFDSTGPITEKLLYRVDASLTSSDGYVERGDVSGTALSAALTYRSAPNLTFTLSGDFADRQGGYYNGTPLINGVIDRSLREVNYGWYDTKLQFSDRRMTLMTEWQLSNTFKIRNATYYIGAHRLWRFPYQFDYQPVSNDIVRNYFGNYEQFQDQFGNHVEAIWNKPLFGLNNTMSFGFDVDLFANDRYVDSYDGSDVLDLRNSSPGQSPAAIAGRNYQKSSATQLPLYAEDRLALLPNVSLIGGIRVEHSAITREDLVDHSIADRLYTPVSWRVGTVIELAPLLNLYGQHSTAVDPVSNLCCIAASQLDYALSDGTQNEVGLKSVALGGRVEWSVAGYQITKNKLLVPDPNNPGLLRQVGQQSSKGVETTVMLKPADQWRVEANLAVLKAQYDDFAENVNGVLVSRNGNTPDNTPRQLANLWVTWAFAPAWLAQTSVKYSGEMYADAANNWRLPSYTLVDAGVRWRVSQKTDIDFRGNNLFDNFYPYKAIGNTSQGGQWLMGKPRSFDVAVSTKF